MENNTEGNENEPRMYSGTGSGLNGTEDEVSSASINGKGLKFSLLRKSYRVPDIPKRYIEPTILDTSLPYIPVYIHLKTYDLKPIERPTTPPILNELRLKCSDGPGYTESNRLSKASPSTGLTSRGRSPVSLKSWEIENKNIKQS